MTEQERLEKNKSISNTKRETIERHSKMFCKTFDVKIQENQLSKDQKEALYRIFLEQKWLKNYILNWSDSNPSNKISKFDIKQDLITHKDKDGNDVEVELKYLSKQSRQCLLSRMLSNIKTLHSLKARGVQKPGKLKFSKEETIIDFKQYGNSHKIISSKRVRLTGIPGKLLVNGLKQFISIPGIEFANARLIHRGTGFYIQFVVYVPRDFDKRDREEYHQTVGIDFGCQTAFTLSTGEIFDANIQESERLKKLQRKFARQQKGSKGRYYTLSLIKKEYQKLTNQKNDLANKIIAELLKYETIVIQDEQLTNWHKGGHGKAVQHSVLGRVKSKLILSPKTVVLNRFLPTTKLCTNCGKIHDEITLRDRQFVCECGVHVDRDVHAAQNMIWFFENNVGVERTKVTRVEMEALLGKIFNPFEQLLSRKPEDSTL